jgi:hypothetical protein
MKQSRTQYLAILSFIALLSACAPAQVQVLPTQTNIAVVEATSTRVSNIFPTQVATIIAPATAELSCPKINPDIQLNLPKESSEFEASILNYLNEGGDPTRIEATASAAEVQPFFTLSADIDGDLLSEVVISTRDLFEDPATIRIFHCQQNDYQLVKSFTPDGIAFGIPEFATKIFDSESAFMIVRTGRISGWGQDFLAIGWQNSYWQIINLGTGTTPSEIALFDQNADGIKEVFIKTTTAATPGGGISRVFIDIYSWDGKKFVSTNGDMPPGNDRVHYLDDAETAWENSNPLLAISYYEIAARDSNLSSYGTRYEWEHKQTELAKPYQQAFAFFRIVAIWFYLDRPDRASEYIQEMSEAFPKGKLGNEFVLAAQAFSDWYEKEPDFSKSCTHAIIVLDTESPNLVPNHLGDWGVANPMYFAKSDICKLQ